MADFQTVAQQFCEFYYKAFDSDRKSLASLYRGESMLTFESSAIKGVDAIIEKLSSLPFQKIEHRVDTIDSQPSAANDGKAIIAMVTGALLIDEEQKPMNFVQTFQLVPEAGSYYVFNDVFKLVYPAS